MLRVGTSRALQGYGILKRNQDPRDGSLPVRGHGERIASRTHPLPVGQARHPPAMLREVTQPLHNALDSRCTRVRVGAVRGSARGKCVWSTWLGAAQASPVPPFVWT
eukprot:6629766-Prymnesium_polylepis.1